MGLVGADWAQLGTGCQRDQGMRRVFGSKIEPDASLSAVPFLGYRFSTCGASFADVPVVTLGR